MKNKLTKLGVSALCGSLAAVSVANAGTIEVTGSSTLTWVTLGGAVTTGNPLGMDTGLSFIGSGELDNGSTFTATTTHTDKDAYSSANINIDTPSLGSFKFDFGGGGNGIGGYDDNVPTAWEETHGTGVTHGADLAKGVGSSANIGWTLPVIPKIGTTIKFAVAPRNNGGLPSDKTGSGDANYGQAGTGASGMGTDIVLDINPELPAGGINLFAGYSITEDVAGGESDGTVISTDREEGTAGVILTLGPVKAGFQRTAEFTGTRVPGNVDYYANTMWGVSFNVNDNLSISYGDFQSDKGYHGKSALDEWDTSRDMDFMSSTSWQVAYTMGGVSLKLAETEVDNAQYVTGTANDRTGTTISLALAF